mmetsp:Transcript_30985/g.79655  ORF Transcript_30985/g.79655 Transcript_30985/m.79655 type:complete len:376 (+) Transcript_30985:99-1226(+)
MSSAWATLLALNRVHGLLRGRWLEDRDIVNRDALATSGEVPQNRYPRNIREDRSHLTLRGVCEVQGGVEGVPHPTFDRREPELDGALRPIPTQVVVGEADHPRARTAVASRTLDRHPVQRRVQLGEIAIQGADCKSYRPSVSRSHRGSCEGRLRSLEVPLAAVHAGTEVQELHLVGAVDVAVECAPSEGVVLQPTVGGVEVREIAGDEPPVTPSLEVEARSRDAALRVREHHEPRLGDGADGGGRRGSARQASAVERGEVQLHHISKRRPSALGRPLVVRRDVDNSMQRICDQEWQQMRTNRIRRVLWIGAEHPENSTGLVQHPLLGEGVDAELQWEVAVLGSIQFADCRLVGRHWACSVSRHRILNPRRGFDLP